jgi:hypothetical protein
VKIALEKPKTLEELNRKFRVWCDEGYNNNPHSGIKGKTPMQAYSADPMLRKKQPIQDCLGFMRLKMQSGRKKPGPCLLGA